MKTLEERITHLEKLHNVFKEEPEEPKYGTPYWCLDMCSQKKKTFWEGHLVDEKCFKINNVFLKESDCDDKLLRRESMANRIADPKKNDEIWYWSFSLNKACCAGYGGAWFSDWFIGNIHTSEKNCEAWHKKYGEAFENLRSSK